MNADQILQSSLLDIVFDERNHAYGAYELRKTYPERIKKSMLVVFTIVSGALLATTIKPPRAEKGVLTATNDSVSIRLIDEKPEPIELPPPVKPVDVVPPQTEQFVTIVVVPNIEATEPPPSVDELVQAKIGLHDIEGPSDVGLSLPPGDITGDPKGIIEAPPKSTEPFRSVEVQARYVGDWTRFLLRNLKAENPVENGAPAGNYTVLIEFVVDVDGSVSGIHALTAHGYGMEEEAIRVIKKADKWVPAMQNGTNVKAYRRQPITFQVNAEE